ncbi:MAG: hypothetical protein DRN68_01790 [Thaumarchaeota archaeon]|nr:MAG: hypothetical protein DRN68_01790 [Nitrososphaerota archaeon]HDD56871.1 hypothetical protein [Nitrososphaeria archaeon]
MVKQIGVKDELYRKLAYLKGNKSFSWVIERLLDEQGLTELLEQHRLGYPVTDRILGKLDELERRLKRIEEKLEEIQQRPVEQPSREVKVMERVEAESGSVEAPVKANIHRAEDDSRLPSFLRDNPWVKILSGRR